MANVASHRHRQPRRCRVRGVGLIEVLVSLLILVIGLLGLIELTLSSIRFSDEADLRSSAVSLAYDLADRVRANDQARADYVTGFADQPAAASDCSSQSCSPEQLAAWDLAQWKQSLAALLPSGQGAITQNAAGDQLTVQVRWSQHGSPLEYRLTVAF